MPTKLWKLMEDGAKRFKPVRMKYCDLFSDKPCGCALGTLYLQASDGKVKSEWKPWLAPGTKWLTKVLQTKKPFCTDEFCGASGAKTKGMRAGTIGAMIEYLFEEKRWSRERIGKWLKEHKL